MSERAVQKSSRWHDWSAIETTVRLNSLAAVRWRLVGVGVGWDESGWSAIAEEEKEEEEEKEKEEEEEEEEKEKKEEEAGA
jgi:hypothetical protein